MKIFFTATLFSFLLVLQALAQTTPAWQQKVDYKIEVGLDDTLHELNGFITINYQNNSPDTLTYIYFHLWPNAYKDQTTPLAKQMLENGKTSFWYSKPSQRGYLDKIDFKQNAETCRWEYTLADGEICKLFLNQPLAHGESVNITTPFHVKLPETFSRMGHIGQSYQITQWYPKPAVYDKYGWHAFPYIDQGEFYSEFGSFDVSITLPKNYVVGATGDLQDTAEISWMNKKADEATAMGNWTNGGLMSFPPSDKETKTLHYKQQNIHDFGWFADKRYHVLKGEVTLPYTQRKVTTWALFTNNQARYWSKAPEYLHDAIQYYSLWIGEYPYNQVTAVDGTISAGSGMEYPNVTVIGEERSDFSLDDVITHEVGHNWFYGMLGSNERDHAWMDEGINSYYEYRYIRTKYPNQKMLGSLPEVFQKFLDVSQYKHKYLMDLGYQLMARENTGQPIELTSSKFTDVNYGLQVYGKSMLIFSYLEAYLGTEVFDKVMKKYFITWQYHHPQPEDVRSAFETETGKNLSWFFDGLLNTTKTIDYKIACVDKEDGDNDKDKHLDWEKLEGHHDEKKGEEENEEHGNDSLHVILKNAGQIASPVPVQLMKKDSVVYTAWVDGFTGKKEIALPKLDADHVQIDNGLVVPEINRRNNQYRLNKLAHKFEKLQFHFLVAAEDQRRTQVLFAPYFGWNNYDKFQVGLAIYSPFIPKRKFNYLLVPAIGAGSKKFIGFAKINYNFFPDKVQCFTVGLNAKRFSYLLFPTALTMNKLEPYIHFDFKPKDERSPWRQSLNLRSAVIFEGVTNPIITYADNPFIKTTQHYYVNEARYVIQHNTTLHPFYISITARQGNDFAGLWAEGNFKVSYKQRGQGLSVRLFAGGFPVYFKSSSDINAPLPALYLSTCTTPNFAYWLQKDYMFDENFIDRNGQDKYLGRQVAMSGGGFYSLTDVGRTSKFLMAANVSSTIYKYVPIQPFFSLGAFMNDNKKMQFAAEFGLSAVIIKDMIEIHLPLATTNNIKQNQQYLGLGKWYQKFSFTLKLKLFKPLDLIRQVAGI